MNPTNGQTEQVQAIISKSKTCAIVLPANPSYDSVASGTALYLGLTVLGKSVSLACSTPVKNELTASDKIQPMLSATGDNLILSFPYTDGAIDKVDYNIQGDRFNIIVAPRQGFPHLSQDQVRFSYGGGSIDTIITIDSPTLNSIGELYTGNQKDFQGKEIINIDRHLTNGYYGTANMVNKTKSSTSEMIFQILQLLGININKDIATNLYAGITAATNNFGSYSVNADTFEAASQLLKSGALKKPQQSKPVVQKQNFQQPMVRTNIMPQQPTSIEQQPVRPIETVEKIDQSDEGVSPASQDWLKPKIFRGTGLV